MQLHRVFFLRNITVPRDQRRLTLPTLVVLFAGLLGGCATGNFSYPAKAFPTAEQQSDSGMDTNGSAREAVLFSPYRIEAGDQLAIQFFYNSDLDQNVRVQPDGAITIPLLGTRRISGLTIPEVTEILQTAYATEIRQPDVILQLVESARQVIYVAGAVGNPGELDYRRGMSVLDGIVGAGGYQSGAKLNVTLLVRKNQDGTTTTRRIDVYKLIQQGDRTTYLQPGDVVIVPGKTS